MGYSLWGCKESDAHAHAHAHAHTHTHTYGGVDATDTRFLGSTQ